MNPTSIVILHSSFLLAASADDAKGEPRGTTVPHQPSDLMPVELIGVHLSPRLGDPETLEP